MTWVLSYLHSKTAEVHSVLLNAILSESRFTCPSFCSASFLSSRHFLSTSSPFSAPLIKSPLFLCRWRAVYVQIGDIFPMCATGTEGIGQCWTKVDKICFLWLPKHVCFLLPFLKVSQNLAQYWHKYNGNAEIRLYRHVTKRGRFSLG